MKKLVLWAVAMMVLIVGAHEAIILLGVSPDNALALAFAILVLFAFVAVAAEADLVPVATALAAAVALVPAAAVALVPAAAEELKVPYWQALAVMGVEAGGVLVGLLVVWWWVLPAIGGEILLYYLFAPRPAVLASRS